MELWWPLLVLLAAAGMAAVVIVVLDRAKKARADRRQAELRDQLSW